MDVKEKIRQFIIEEVCLDGTIKDLADDDLLIESGIIDSMGILTLLAFLEENFKIHILVIVFVRTIVKFLIQRMLFLRLYLKS